MVLETALGGRLNEYFTASRLKKTVDNEQFSHRAVEAGTQLRIDGESGSFWVGYGFSAAAFPDYDLDYSEHVLMLRAVVDLAADTALDVELQVGSRAYSERFLLDTAGTAGKESAGETTFAADCGLTQAFGAAFSMTLSLAYERLAGNGNLFFFGPGETELVEDGDEVLLEDFYSRHVFSVRLSGKYRLGPWLLSPEIGIQLVRYDSRPAFTAMDEPLSGTPQADTVPQAALAADWRLGETLTLVFRGTCARSFSNSARADHPLYTASLGVELDF
jgi:hypothetical protein